MTRKFCVVGTVGGKKRTFLEELKIKCNEISVRPTIGPTHMTSSPNTELPPLILVSIQYFPAAVVKEGLHNNSPVRSLRILVYIYVSTCNYTVITK